MALRHGSQAPGPRRGQRLLRPGQRLLGRVGITQLRPGRQAQAPHGPRPHQDQDPRRPGTGKPATRPETAAAVNEDLAASCRAMADACRSREIIFTATEADRREWEAITE
jgi:hypothetical protein